MSWRLENQRALTKNLMEEIVDYANLKRAYKQLSNNGGSSGVDGMEIEQLRKWFGEHLNKLREALLTERYEVNAVRKAEIPKPTGGIRNTYGKRQVYTASHSSTVKPIVRTTIQQP